VYYHRPLELDAYKLALDNLKAGIDTEAYKKVGLLLTLKPGVS
jgi:hypothetical protein